ncbi:MAG: RHS repeat-associated core domain-containing protein [Candidatus Acidiferrales bacterium]
MNDPTGTYAFAYDNMGRIIGTTTTYSFMPNIPFTNSYSYDADSNRAGYTAPDGSTNTYSYDTLNRLTTLANSWAGSFGLSYDSLSRRTQMTRPNGITTNYTYDSLSRLLSVLHQAGGSTIDGASYALDAAGNRTAKTDDLTGITSNYTYDKIYELTQVTQGSDTKETYGYDPVGNRQSSLSVPSYTVNSSNELTSNSNASYTYDDNGDTTSKTTSSGTTNYTWDFESRLASVTLPGSGGTATFKYDPFGRRIQKAVTQNGTTTTTDYLYNGDNEVETTDQNGSVVAKFAQGQSIDEPLAESNSSGAYFYQQDGLGSVTSISNGAGQLAQTYTYSSFGDTINSTGNVANPFRYTSRHFDSETGLYYYRARYYDPTVGSFLSEDKFQFDAEHDFYVYVGNSVLNAIDPSGNTQQDVGTIVSTASSAVGLMTAVGLRFNAPGFANNAIATATYVYDGLALQPDSGLPFKIPYLGCGQQSEFVVGQEIPLIPKLQDNWNLSELWRLTPFFHQYVAATDNNPKDPDVIIDPYNNQYQLIPKGGNLNSNSWQPLYK